MKIKIEDALREYMMCHGPKDILLYVKSGGYSKMAFLSVNARFLKKSDTGLAEAGYEFMEWEGGKIYYHPDEVIFEENAQLLCNKFLGKVVLQVMGISVNA